MAKYFYVEVDTDDGDKVGRLKRVTDETFLHKLVDIYARVLETNPYVDFIDYNMEVLENSCGITKEEAVTFLDYAPNIKHGFHTLLRFKVLAHA